MISNIKKTNFFNTSLGIKIYSQLKLDFQNLDCSDLDDNQTNNFNFMQFNLLELESQMHDKISTILQSPTLSLFEKQRELEKFSYENQNYKLNVDYHLPQQLNKMVKQIDKYMLNKDQLYSTDNSYYLISNIQKGLGNLDDSNKTQNYLTSKNTKIIKTLKIILQLFKFNNQSFGLFLIYNFVYKVRKNALQFYDKENKPFMEISKKIDFSSIDEETSSDNKYIKLDLSLVELVSFFGKNLIIHYNACRPVVVSMLQQQIFEKEKDNNVNYTNLSEEKKKKLISKNLEINDQIFFHNLNSLQKIDAFNDKTEFELGIICTLLLQIVGLISETRVSEFNDTSYKTVKKLLLNKKYRGSIFTVPANPRKLPMILRPNFWQHETKDINLHFGGYLYNEKLNYPGVFNRHKKGVATFTKYELQAINYLQSNFYEINSEFLKVLEQNSKESILNYLKGIPRYSHLFLIESESDFLIVKNFSQFLTTDSLYQILLKQKEETTSATKSLKHEILRVRQRLKEEYQILFNLLVQFVHAYSLSVLFEGYKLYFCIFLDARGRMYYTGSGGGFGLQAGGFGKYVLDLKGNDFRDDSIILEKIPLDNKYYLEYINQVKAEDFFEHLKVRFQIKQTTIGKDASCSGTSIISGLIGYLNGILLTNVLYQSKNGRPEKKFDIYENFGRTLKEKYPNSYDDLKPYFHNHKNFVNVHLKKYKIEEEQFKLHVTNVLAKIKLDILKRSSLKQFVMCKNYSQGDQGRSRYIFETCDYFLTTQAYNLKIDKYICQALGKWVAECYKAKFPKISDFCALLLRSINHQQPVTLISGVHTVTEKLYHGAMEYQQVYSETVTIRYPNVNPNLKGRMKKLNYSIMTNDLDERKAKQSLIANFIHYLDSRLCLLVIYKCQLQNICIWTNHDCFYVHPNSVAKVIHCYFDSYKFLLLEHNLIENFIAVNNGKLTQKDSKLITEFQTSRLQILKELESKTLMLSPFCLN